MCERVIRIDFSRPGTPTDNATVELFNSRLRQECLNENGFMSLEDARRKIGAWRIHYNQSRPHSALGWMTAYEFSCLLAGHAIGVLQFPVCRNEIAQGSLIPILSHYPIPPFKAWLLHPPAGMMSYETRICAGLLERYLKTSLSEMMGYE